MNRQLTEVIDQMMEHIPQDEESLRATLTDIRGSADFSPPENQSMWWLEVRDALIEEFDPEDPDDFEEMCQLETWKKQVLGIFNPVIAKDLGL